MISASGVLYDTHPCFFEIVLIVKWELGPSMERYDPVVDLFVV